MQMSKFQLALLILFGLAIVGGIVAFSIYKGSGAVTTDLAIWGTLPSNTWNAWYAGSPLYQNRAYRINYTYVSEDNFDSELTNAIAEGRGPDIVLAFHDRILKQIGKLMPIPYASFALRSFQDTFIDGAVVLATPNGELGVPLLVDPLVLYYNKDIFANFSLVQPPQLWEQIYTLAQSMTIRDKNSGNILKATIPLGASSNVLRAKEILSTLIIQAGGRPVVDIQTQPGGSPSTIRASISDSFNLPFSPGNAALLYFTEFSNPAKVFYTWNRSLSDSLSDFSAGDSAMLIGFASDYQKIKEKNPNLNFDVYFLPQSSSATRAITFGRMLVLAVSKGSQKISPAFGAIFEMMGKQSVEVLSGLLGLPPTRRDSLQTKPQNPIQAVFYSSAIQAVAWKDPDTDATRKIFYNMIDSVTSGRARVEEAVNNAQDELQALIDKIQPPL